MSELFCSPRQRVTAQLFVFCMVLLLLVWQVFSSSLGEAPRTVPISPPPRYLCILQRNEKLDP